MAEAGAAAAAVPASRQIKIRSEQDNVTFTMDEQAARKSVTIKNMLDGKSSSTALHARHISAVMRPNTQPVCGWCSRLIVPSIGP